MRDRVHDAYLGTAVSRGAAALRELDFGGGTSNTDLEEPMEGAVHETTAHPLLELADQAAEPP